jgi:hypothetical protein
MGLAPLFRARALGRRCGCATTQVPALARVRVMQKEIRVNHLKFLNSNTENSGMRGRGRRIGSGIGASANFVQQLRRRQDRQMYVRRPFTSRPAVFLHSDSTFFRHKAAEQGKAHAVSARRNRRSRTGRERRLIAGWLVGYTAASGRWHFASERTFAHG